MMLCNEVFVFFVFHNSVTYLKALLCRLFLLGLLVGCIEELPPKDEAKGTDSYEEYLQTAGFISIPSRYVEFGGHGFSEKGFTDKANIFYSFIPAENDVDIKPVFLFINGGPGAATSSALAAWGTGPFSVADFGSIIENKRSFRDMGSLIYIDTRQTGFSFDEIDFPSDETSRNASFNFINYNIYTDAADILLTLSSLWKKYQKIEDNPVVLVAESYGGSRAAAILKMAHLLSLSSNNETVYRDKVLDSLLTQHYTRISDNPAHVTAANQFKNQILIQPGIVLPMKIEEKYMLYCLCNRITDNDPRAEYCNKEDIDYSDIREPFGFFHRQVAVAQQALITAKGFEAFFGIPYEQVSLFRPENRLKAFRFVDSEGLDKADFSVFAGLAAWDAHHITMNLAPYRLWNDPSYDAGAIVADDFIRALATVNTFITNAYYDYAVNVSGLPEALMEWSNIQSEPIFTDVRILPEKDSDRSGWMEIVFAKETLTGKNRKRVIRMPQYMNSGHSVTMYQADEFLRDVEAFLATHDL